MRGIYVIQHHYISVRTNMSVCLCVGRLPIRRLEKHPHFSLYVDDNLNALSLLYDIGKTINCDMNETLL